MSEKFLPDFFIIGAQKSGTSTLHHILENTNLVSLPKNKETLHDTINQFIRLFAIKPTNTVFVNRPLGGPLR